MNLLISIWSCLLSFLLPSMHFMFLKVYYELKSCKTYTLDKVYNINLRCFSCFGLLFVYYTISFGSHVRVRSTKVLNRLLFVN